jgi:uncharacterized protein YndB with AHSA1/START domain
MPQTFLSLYRITQHEAIVMKKKEAAIRKAKIIHAAPNVVFNALTEPEKITGWFQDEAILDSKVGGKISLVTRAEIHPDWNLDKDYYMNGTIMEFVPNKRLSYSWKFDDSPSFPETVVTWDLERINSEKTRVKLGHIGFTGKEKGNFSLESHNQGWAEALDKLAKYCESGANS